MKEDKTLNEEQRKKKLHKLEEGYFYRRMINSTYYKHLKLLVLSGDFM